MAIKFRYADMKTGTTHAGAGAVSGEARKELGLSQPFGCIRAVEVKGDDADVDTNAAWSVVDADGRLIFVSALDAGATTYDQYTSQVQVPKIGDAVAVSSTVGFVQALGYPELVQTDIDGLHNDDTGGEVPSGVFAKSPLVITLTAGTDGDWHRIGFWVEV